MRAMPLPVAAMVSGFTLVELMVTLAIAVVLATIAVPSFRSYTANQAVRSASFNVMSDLMYARSEAVKRNTSVTLAPTGDSWTSGWRITVGAQTLRESGALNNSIAIQAGTPASVTFGASGRVQANGMTQFGLSASAGSMTQNRCIVLDPSGMPKITKAACA